MVSTTVNVAQTLGRLGLDTPLITRSRPFDRPLEHGKKLIMSLVEYIPRRCLLDELKDTVEVVVKGFLGNACRPDKVTRRTKVLQVIGDTEVGHDAI